MKRIDQIDTNFRLDAGIPPQQVWLRPEDAPLQVYGLAPNAQGTLCRLPLELLPSCSEGVQNLAWHLAGGCIRFTTDSPGLALVWKLKAAGVMPHFTACGQSGMELFEEFDGGWRQVKNFIPRLNNGCGCLQEQSAYAELPGGLRHYALYLPLYNGLDELVLGFAPGTRVEAGRTPGVARPIVFYGSSITQGGCAGKCGSCYTHLVCRRLDAAHINLGFAGNARGEEVMARYIAGLEMSAFVMDYDHNAPDAAHLEKTHEAFFRIVRQAQPELPILLISKPDYDKNPQIADRRREVIRRTWRRAVEAGDRRVWFADGQTLFGGTDRDLCTVDGTHPNDLGFLRMADALEPVLKEMLRKGDAQ